MLLVGPVHVTGWNCRVLLRGQAGYPPLVVEKWVGRAVFSRLGADLL